MRIFHFATAFSPVPGHSQPPLQLVAGAFTPGEKKPVREADHSLPCSAEVNNALSYTSISPLLSLRDVLN